MCNKENHGGGLYVSGMEKRTHSFQTNNLLMYMHPCGRLSNMQTLVDFMKIGST
jgi:hypothetical protein